MPSSTSVCYFPACGCSSHSLLGTLEVSGDIANDYSSSMVSWLSSLASVGMAIGPPLVYADQAFSIVKKRCAFSVSILLTLVR